MSSRIKIEDIQKEIAQYGWKLISDKYENLDSELIFKCAEGHTIYAPWRKLRTKCECPICKKNQQNWNYQQIKPKNKNTYRILAVDQATYNSGFSIFDGNELLRYGIHSTTAPTEEARISEIKNWFIQMLLNWAPDEIILEDIQLQDESVERDGNRNTMGVTVFKSLAHLQGVLINVAFEQKIPCKTVLSTVWRKEMGVKGKTRTDKKKSAQLLIKQIYDVNVSNDEADAICIGHYGVNHHKKQVELIEW